MTLWQRIKHMRVDEFIILALAITLILHLPVMWP